MLEKSNLKPLVSSVNIDAVYLDGKYQDESRPFSLSENNIDTHQFVIELTTNDHKHLKLCFYSLEDLFSFANAYDLK